MHIGPTDLSVKMEKIPGVILGRFYATTSLSDSCMGSFYTTTRWSYSRETFILVGSSVL